MYRNLMIIMVAFGLIAGVAMPGFAGYDGYTPGHKHFDLQTKAFQLVQQHWLSADRLLAYVNDPTDANLELYNKTLEIQKKQSVELAKFVQATFDEDSDTLEALSDIYKSLDPAARTAFYAVLGVLKADIVQDVHSKITPEQFREYFPGYGYTEPGYKYRKGREVERENKGVTWQSEEHSIQTNFQAELTISLDILDILKGMATGGVIKNLKILDQFETNVNGQPLICAKVSFQVIKTITTRTNRKFDVNKIWFELLRAKSSGWSNGPWEVCGKTYQIINEPTGEEVVTGVQQKN
ncbi:MAG TPA: hypothetical protein PKM25_18635, partial [Candidatus Ozemobacteraceae bacterium]|nr:hypothetical protein [Candidatus Ozemobacteraceae bacterium]